jgi:acetyl-CoA carboxylase biotin carboxylase subunit
VFKKVLIANRGEVALRVLRACRELGCSSVVVYSEADRNALPTLLADEAVCIGPAPAQDSYLNVSRVLSAGEITRCDALHPGYGFLADRPEFAEATESCGLVFVGASPDTLRRTNDKIAGRALARAAGVPLVPGSEAEVATSQDAARIGAGLGYPVIVKAASGSGGAGKHAVRRERDLDAGFRMCQAEARATFGDARVYIEKLVPNARHIEVQLLADRHGNVLALPERDCSVQFRYRKLVEETPSPAVTPASRARLRQWAEDLGRAAGLTTAGTVEFLADEHGDCYFLEMDCGLHVEHAVTEMTTGWDIVHEQFRAAAGERLDPARRLEPSGHAIECRICAEDPDAGFEPGSGLVTETRMPGGPGLRVDGYVAPGYFVPSEYDTLIAKIVAWAPDRAAAIARMARALAETSFSGIATTVGLHRRLMQSGRFRRGRLAIGMLDEELSS